MMWLIFFFVFSSSQEIVELVKVEKELEAETILVSELVHTLRDISQESHIMTLLAQINNLRDNVVRIGKTIDIMDKISLELTKDLLDVDEELTKEAIASFDVLSEHIAVLEAKIVEFDDKTLQKNIKLTADKAESVEKQIRSKLVWILEEMKNSEKYLESSWAEVIMHAVLGVVCIIIFCSLKILHKALK